MLADADLVCVSALLQNECLVDRPYDGPSKKLLAYMAENSVSEWQGFANIG
eukprot:COSAG02_NODE_6659_length_3432_cov_4.956196_2_plen_51_part_00